MYEAEKTPLLLHNIDYVTAKGFLLYPEEKEKLHESQRKNNKLQIDMNRKEGMKMETRGRKEKKKRNALLIGIAAVLVVGVLCLIGVFQQKSIYRQIVQAGYTGTQEQWLASLVGEETDRSAKSAYQLAVENGYKGSETEWTETLCGTSAEFVDVCPEDLSSYESACRNGFQGSLSEWLIFISDDPEGLGKSGKGEKKTEYELACEYGYTGTFTEWLVSITHDRVFE